MYEEIRMLFDNLRNLVAETEIMVDINHTEERIIAIFRALQATINIHHTNNMTLLDEMEKLKKEKGK